MTNYTRFGTYNAVLPSDGPKAYPFTLDFRTVGTAQINMESEIVQGHIKYVSGIFVDNSLNENPLTITTEGVNQKVKIPPKSQAYMPLLITDAAVLDFSTTVNNQLLVPIDVLNFPVHPHVWSAV